MSLLKDILGLALPAICCGCGEPLIGGEEILCLGCLGKLDRADGPAAASDILRERIAIRSPLIRGVHSSLIYTHENLVGRLIRHGKYDDRPDIFNLFGAVFARELRSSRLIHDIDMLVPVPMHPWKRMLRGYNQAEIIAGEIGRENARPVAGILKATRLHTSQTRRTASGRRESTLGLFRLSEPERVTGRHIAVVDDIITTGSTISAAIQPILDASPASVTILALAATAKG